MKLRNQLAYLAAIALLASCNGNKDKGTGFQLTGTLTNAGEGASVYLEQLATTGTRHLDSTTIDKTGNFTFHTKGITKGFYNLRLTDASFATLILDSTEHVSVTGNAKLLGDTYTVGGSEDSKLFCDWNSEMKTIAYKTDSLQRLFNAILSTYDKKDTARMDSLSKAFEGPYDNFMAKEKTFITSFVKAHPTSFACIVAIEQITFDDNVSTYTTLDNALSKAYPTSEYVSKFHEDVIRLKKAMVGAPAPDFTMPDPDGKDISLSSFKGKVVLLDFWASWCGPCRASMPGMIKVYNKFKDKNFTILGVSLDKDHDSWVAGIKELKLTWPQMSDLKYWNCAAVPLYNFGEHGIPYNVLVGTDGTILAKDMDEQMLTAKLDELFAKK